MTTIPPAVEVAAVDLGATSGRVVHGRVDTDGVTFEVTHRFWNGPVRTPDGLSWDVLSLWRGALDGLAAAVRAAGPDGLASIGVDSWAVDYGLLRADASSDTVRLLANPRHYRDDRNAAGVDLVHAALDHTAIDRAGLYARNGLQFLPFNTLYQLAAERAGGLLDLADGLLLVPDLLTFWLTGSGVAEVTNASTTGLLTAADRAWDDDLIDRLGFPRSLFADLVDPGTRVGATLPTVSAEIGAAVPVVAVGSHDTASAVAAVPMADPSTAAYVSCGTWGLVGLELETPMLTEEARLAGFTNEAGVDCRVRFLHNVMGLWLLNEAVAWWSRTDVEPVDLVALLAAAADEPTPPVLVDPNDPAFLAPADMVAALADHLTTRGAAVPATRPAWARLIVESLAVAFADAVDTAARLTGRDVEVIHVVGGGALNTLLCQLTADRSGRPVVAGPVEATALGNLLVQARAVAFAGESLEALRSRTASSELATYAPRPRHQA